MRASAVRSDAQCWDWCGGGMGRDWSGGRMGVDPHHSPIGREACGGDDWMGIDGMRGPKRRRGCWWDRLEQRVLYEGVNFAQDSVDGADEDYEFIPNSDEEGDVGWLHSGVDDNEFIPETEPQDLLGKYSGGKVAGGLRVHADKKVVQACEEDDNAKKDMVQTAFVGVDPDAETDDESIPMEGNKNEVQKVSSDSQDFEDFKFELMLQFYPSWAHPTLKLMKGKRD